jgi:hypothetical protein
VIVKSSALILLTIGIVVAREAGAESISNQPLTRIDCVKAGLSWNDNANVCALTSERAMEAANHSGQPLTRSECDTAGMSWNDKANVCGEKTESQAASTAINPVPATILINIDKAKQRMTIFLDGVESYNWPVSTGKAVTQPRPGPLLPLP